MLSYIPEERMRDGMIRNFTVAENMILREHHKQPFSRSGCAIEPIARFSRTDRLGKIARCSGTQFDPQVVSAFVRALDAGRARTLRVA